MVRNDDDRLPPRPPTPHSTASQRTQPTDRQQDRTTTDPDFRTRQRSPPDDDDDDRSQETIHFETDQESSQDSDEAHEEQLRLSEEISNIWDRLENVGALFATKRHDPNANLTSQALTNTSVQQSIRNQQGLFPAMVRPCSAQISRFGVSNPNSPYLLRVPRDNGPAPTPNVGWPATSNPGVGSDQGRRNTTAPSPRITTGHGTDLNPAASPFIAVTGDTHAERPRSGEDDALALPSGGQETSVTPHGAVDRDFERELHEAIATSLQSFAADMNQDTTRQVNDLSSRVGTAMGSVTSIMRAQERRQSLVMGSINRTMRDLNYALDAMSRQLGAITADPWSALPALPAILADPALPALPAAVPQPTAHNAGHMVQPTHAITPMDTIPNMPTGTSPPPYDTLRSQPGIHASFHGYA
jgi:hypothetical protein